MQVYGKIILCVYMVHICLAEALDEHNKNNIIASELCAIKNSQDERKREKDPAPQTNGANHLNDNTDLTNDLMTHFKFSIWSLALAWFFFLTSYCVIIIKIITKRN